jgi:hypothetical protein
MAECKPKIGQMGLGEAAEAAVAETVEAEEEVDKNDQPLEIPRQVGEVEASATKRVQIGISQQTNEPLELQEV